MDIKWMQEDFKKIICKKLNRLTLRHIRWTKSN